MGDPLLSLESWEAKRYNGFAALPPVCGFMVAKEQMYNNGTGNKLQMYFLKF